MRASSLAPFYDSYEKPGWRFDCALARFFWLSDHHEGQWSEKYRQLCTLLEPGNLRPGPNASLDDPENETIREIYAHYCEGKGCIHGS